MKNTLFDELFSGLDDSYRNWDSCFARGISSKYLQDVGDVYKAQIELAGFSKENVSVSLSDEALKILAKSEDKNKSFVIHLNNQVSHDHITCSMDNGLLEIILPKKSIAESRQIEIE
jgi:HSP20 family molecular chaperone IbpA